MAKLIAPSILAADFSILGEEIKKVEDAGADWIHLDIMDGHFVPNLTMGPALAAGIRKMTKLPFDCHLMVEEPAKFVGPFVDAGVNALSIHIETCDPAKLIPEIKDFGCKAGIVLNPETSISKIMPYLMHADYVLVMTVNPGFAGQSFMPEVAKKIDILKAFREAQNLKYLIEVDGGINFETIEQVKNADIIVAGNGIFKTPDYKAAIRKMKDLAGRE